MSGLVSASTPTSTFSSIQQSKIQSKRYINPCNSVVIPTTQLCSSDLSLKSCCFGGVRVPQRSSIICRSSTGPGAPGSGVSCTKFPSVHFFCVKLYNCDLACGFPELCILALFCFWFVSEFHAS